MANVEPGEPDTLIRTVHSGRGFLSQASKRIHFGLGGKDKDIKQLTVRWPDGQVQRFDDLNPGHHYKITQGKNQASIWTRPNSTLALQPAPLEPLPLESSSRIVISGRLPMPGVRFKSIQTGQRVPQAPTLINLWATDCLPCIDELKTLTQVQSKLRQAGLNVLALNVDQLIDDPTSDLTRATQITRDIDIPFAVAAIDGEQSGMLDLFHQAFLSLRRPLPVPSSFLTSADGRVAVIYTAVRSRQKRFSPTFRSWTQIPACCGIRPSRSQGGGIRNRIGLTQSGTRPRFSAVDS